MPMKFCHFTYPLLILSLFSCDKKQSVDSKDVTNKTTIEHHETQWEMIENATLKNWTDYYLTTIDSSFSLTKFELQSKSELQKMKGSVAGLFDENFDQIYQEFIIYSPNKEMYIDLDSYLWSFDSLTNRLIYEADQEVNLVHNTKKKIERIGFRGPSYRVEDAFWLGDSVVVFLETSSDKVPTINKIDLKSNTITNFMYQDTLMKASDYSKTRISNKLKNYFEKDKLSH